MRGRESRLVATGRIPLRTEIALGLGGLAALFVLITLGMAKTAPPATIPTLTATPLPTYASASDCIDMILTQERAGQWDVAETNARTCVTRPNLSPADTSTLVQKALADGLQAMNARPINAGDYAAQQLAVDKYEDLKRFAQVQGAALPKTFYEIAEDAANTNRFLLARVAFHDAFDRGDVRSANVSHIRFVHNASYNLGWWLTRSKAHLNYDKGLGLLVAADHLDGQYHLGLGLARRELKQLEPDESKWPNPPKTPFLSNDSGEKEN